MSNILKSPNALRGAAALGLVTAFAVSGCTSQETQEPAPIVIIDQDSPEFAQWIKVTSVSENLFDGTISFTSSYPDGTEALSPKLMCEAGKVIMGEPGEKTHYKFADTLTTKGCEGDNALTLSDQTVVVGQKIDYVQTPAGQAMIDISSQMRK